MIQERRGGKKNKSGKHTGKHTHKISDWIESINRHLKSKYKKRGRFCIPIWSTAAASMDFLQP
jgi:hypothetical protein